MHLLTTMATAHAFFPSHFYDQHRRTLSLRDAGILCIAVALVCAASVFIILSHLDQGYPVAAVRQDMSRAPASYAVVARAQRSPQATAGPAIAKPEERIVHRLEPVARTHQELLALERTGERNYVEFSIARSGGFHPVGPIQICLWRADSKHASVQASVLYHRRRIDFKRLKMNERVSIPAAQSQSLDLVVNGVTKNQITGYLSEPKNSGLE